MLPCSAQAGTLLHDVRRDSTCYRDLRTARRETSTCSCLPKPVQGHLKHRDCYMLLTRAQASELWGALMPFSTSHCCTFLSRSPGGATPGSSLVSGWVLIHTFMLS